ncbi:SH3 domain-containing protein [Propionibacteriaceae bacterium Y1685]|uniref:SH3 domain-containing protein n=1 Tax=Microlunatus sp. Y1700 TaxID=3418487 RepID=UPI003B820538
MASATLMGGIATMAVSGNATADTDRVTTWTAVNVRSGPGTNHKVVGGMYPGQLVQILGPSQYGWTPVKFNGKKAYLSSRYVRAAGKGESSSTAGSGTTDTGKAFSRVATAALNVRTGPSTTYRVVTVLAAGTKVNTTSGYRNGFTEIKYGGQNLWVSSEYLADKASAPTNNFGKLPKTIGSRVLTTALMIRTSSGSNYQSLGDLPKGSWVAITGTTRNGMAEIVYKGAVRWVNAAYLVKPNSGPSKPSTPKVIGTRYATTELMIRTSSGKNFKSLRDVPKGTALSITGVNQNGMAQIIWDGAVRWVNGAYLSKSKPSAGGGNSGTNPSGGKINGSGLSGLRPSTKNLMYVIHNRYPQIKWYNGVRPDSLPDHPSGRALDIMLTDYKSANSRATGYEIANYVRANARSLGVQYVIWDQKIWNISRDSEGWRHMAGRGSDTANHKDHVHVTMK